MADYENETEPGTATHSLEEQESLVRTLGSELTDIFLHFIHGEISFADLTFETYETLQDVYIIASGEYELEFESALEYEVDESALEENDEEDE